MNTKKIFKRITAVATGATMLGATVMGALAADLSNYPSDFVTDGVFNGLIVLGENAATVDNLASIDIATSMMAPSTAGLTTTTVEGDSWLVGTSAKYLEIADNDDAASSIGGEDINDIATFISEDELGALADGSWGTNENEYGFQQFLFFDSVSGTSEIVKYSENDDDVTADHFYIANNNQIARYKLEFTSTAQSDVTDSNGAASATGLYLDDFEDTTIDLMGNSYTVVQARRPTTSGGGAKLILMAGATSDSLLEGESKSFTVDGTDYDVSLIYVDQTFAKFVVNGETTSKVSDGGTYVLSDGTEIGVSDVLYQSYAGGIHSSSFFLGASKLEFQDTDVAVSTSSHELQVGSESIDGADVIITGTDDNTTFSISTIELNMTAQDDYFVGAGEKLSDVVLAAGDEKEILFANAFDVEYLGLEDKATHDVRLKTSSSTRYELHLFDGDGHAVDVPVAYAQALGNLTQGREPASSSDGNREALVHNESVNIYKDDYFILSAGTASDGSAKSYLLQYTSADDSDKTSPKIKFKNMGSGETLEYSVATANPRATIKLGGYSFIVQNASVTSAGDDMQINVDLNGSGAVGAGPLVDFVDSYGSNWAIGPLSGDGNSSSSNTFTITQSTPNADDYDNDAPTNIALAITATTSGDVEVRAAQSGLTLFTPDGESNIAYGYTSMGAFVTFDEPSSDPDSLTISYPEEQRLAQVYVTSGATSSVSASGDLVSVTVVDATKLDSEVASVSAQNLIVVGGPCVNTVAATLLGNPANCADGFTPGKARVKLFEAANGNVAMLVAGYSGADTRLAGRVLAHRWSEMSGMEVEIEGTTYSDATIGAPVAVAAVVEEPVVEEAMAEEVVE